MTAVGVGERKVGSGVAEDHQRKGCYSFRVVDPVERVKVLMVETKREWTLNDASRSDRVADGLDGKGETKRGLEDDS